MPRFVIKVMDHVKRASIQFGMHADSWEREGSVRDARGAAETLSSYHSLTGQVLKLVVYRCHYNIASKFV